MATPAAVSFHPVGVHSSVIAHRERMLDGGPNVGTPGGEGLASKCAAVWSANALCQGGPCGGAEYTESQPWRRVGGRGEGVKSSNI